MQTPWPRRIGETVIDRSRSGDVPDIRDVEIVQRVGLIRAELLDFGRAHPHGEWSLDYQVLP